MLRVMVSTPAPPVYFCAADRAVVSVTLPVPVLVITALEAKLEPAPKLSAAVLLRLTAVAAAATRPPVTVRALSPLIATVVAPLAVNAPVTVLVVVPEDAEAMFSVVWAEPRVMAPLTVPPFRFKPRVVAVAVVSAPAVSIRLVPVPARVTEAMAPEFTVAAP